MTGERCECGVVHDIDPVPNPDEAARMWDELADVDQQAEPLMSL